MNFLEIIGVITLLVVTGCAAYGAYVLWYLWKNFV